MPVTLSTPSSRRCAVSPSDRTFLDVAMSHDPLGFEGGDANLYRYCGNDPTNKTDPSGLQSPATIGNFNNPPPVLPAPGAKGDNAKYLFENYWITWFATSKTDRIKPIPGVVTFGAAGPPVGIGGGSYQIYSPPSKLGDLVGGGGALTCSVLVVKGIANGTPFVAVFHFTAGDSPGPTLQKFKWPKGCNAIMCGGNETPQSNCLADDVLAAAKSAGIDVVGVSENSGCGVNANGNWYQWGH
jgi:hypothetical protein